jgi:uncharacterized membrane protein
MPSRPRSGELAPDPSSPQIRGRVEGIDIARGFAGLIMIQGHAYDGWASAAAKETCFYAFTRFLGSLPLPAFLVLAGAAVAWRVQAAEQRGEQAAVVRRNVAIRGLQIVIYGYVMSLAYAVIDGYGSLATLLRADVLHVIGLSIAVAAWIGIRAPRGATTVRAVPLGRTSLGLGIIVLLICPWLSAWTLTHVDGPPRYVVGLFSDVPEVTLMPFVPLFAWFAMGVLAAQAMLSARFGSRAGSPVGSSVGSRATLSARGAPRQTLTGLAVIGTLAAVAGSIATRYLGAAYDLELARTTPLVWLNAIDLGGRGVAVLAIGALVSDAFRGPARSVLLRLGRGSLVAYVFHIPFCYGLFARPFAGKLDMATASALVVALCVLSTLVVYGRDALHDRWTSIRKAST